MSSVSSSSPLRETVRNHPSPPEKTKQKKRVSFSPEFQATLIDPDATEGDLKVIFEKTLPIRTEETLKSPFKEALEKEGIPTSYLHYKKVKSAIGVPLHERPAYLFLTSHQDGVDDPLLYIYQAQIANLYPTSFGQANANRFSLTIAHQLYNRKLSDLLPVYNPRQEFAFREIESMVYYENEVEQLNRPWRIKNYLEILECSSWHLRHDFDLTTMQLYENYASLRSKYYSTFIHHPDLQDPILEILQNYEEELMDRGVHLDPDRFLEQTLHLSDVEEILFLQRLSPEQGELTLGNLWRNYHSLSARSTFWEVREASFQIEVNRAIEFYKNLLQAMKVNFLSDVESALDLADIEGMEFIETENLLKLNEMNLLGLYTTTLEVKKTQSNELSKSFNVILNILKMMLKDKKIDYPIEDLVSEPGFYLDLFKRDPNLIGFLTLDPLATGGKEKLNLYFDLLMAREQNSSDLQISKVYDQAISRLKGFEPLRLSFLSLYQKNPTFKCLCDETIPVEKIALLKAYFELIELSGDSSLTIILDWVYQKIVEGLKKVGIDFSPYKESLFLKTLGEGQSIEDAAKLCFPLRKPTSSFTTSEIEELKTSAQKINPVKDIATNEAKERLRTRPDSSSKCGRNLAMLLKISEEDPRMASEPFAVVIESSIFTYQTFSTLK